MREKLIGNILKLNATFSCLLLGNRNILVYSAPSQGPKVEWVTGTLAEYITQRMKILTGAELSSRALMMPVLSYNNDASNGFWIV